MRQCIVAALPRCQCCHRQMDAALTSCVPLCLGCSSRIPLCLSMYVNTHAFALSCNMLGFQPFWNSIRSFGPPEIQCIADAWGATVILGSPLAGTPLGAVPGRHLGAVALPPAKVRRLQPPAATFAAQAPPLTAAAAPHSYVLPAFARTPLCMELHGMYAPGCGGGALVDIAAAAGMQQPGAAITATRSTVRKRGDDVAAAAWAAQGQAAPAAASALPAADVQLPQAAMRMPHLPGSSLVAGHPYGSFQAPLVHCASRLGDPVHKRQRQ